MNRLMWKLYINSIINPHLTKALPYPSINSADTYCFKIKRILEDKKMFYICPRIGLNDINKILFKSYRITALKINLTNAQFCLNNKLEMIKDHTYYSGSFDLTYWPENPKFDDQKFDSNIDKYWIIIAEKLEIFINYEIYPLYPLITIPKQNFYTNTEEFENYYKSVPKVIINSKYKEPPLVINNIRPDMSVEEFIKAIEKN